MEVKHKSLLLGLVASSIVISLLQTCAATTKNSYVVYMGEHSHGSEPTSVDFDRVENKHHEFLGSFLGCKEKAKHAIIYSHTKTINAFSALLDPKEAEEISKHEDVISIFESRPSKLYTTNSWNYLGMGEPAGAIDHASNPNSLWEKANYGENIIIANLDTGVWPGSAMFNDQGMGPVPAKWKGRCGDENDGSSCNKKLLSMRTFCQSLVRKHGEQVKTLDIFKPIDISGHGTHTLSTAAGRFTSGINMFGFKNATARGGMPNARVASYKVAFEVGDELQPTDEDTLAAFDEAISDGVDVLSISLGAGLVGETNLYLSSVYAIGSLHAVRKGVVVVMGAGNDGPESSTIDNVWPWVITVGASTIDRKFRTSVWLGNQQVLKAVSLSSSSLPEKKLYPLLHFMEAQDFKNATNRNETLLCSGTLDRSKAEGKIILFDDSVDFSGDCFGLVQNAGGVGVIYYGRTYELTAKPTIIPVAHLTPSAGDTIRSYIMNTTTADAKAYIAPASIKFNHKPAPVMASFSSRGPNPFTPEILKPDIIAPGVEIIAASPKFPGGFEMASGTSMATPHVAAVAGLLKAIHPEWSPAIIKSAIMTTATVVNNRDRAIRDYNKKRATPFSMGAGHIQPNKAADPGLVYDLTNDDYLTFLCANGLNNTDVTKFYNATSTCPEEPFNMLNFNYPAITVPRISSSPLTVRRRVKNVGTPGIYTVKVDEPRGVVVTVSPTQLVFSKVGEEKSFELILKADNIRGQNGSYVFGRLEWSDGVHSVTSPISVNLA